MAVRTDGETFSQWRSDIEDVLSYDYANRNLYADVGRETVEYAQTKLRPSLQRLSREVARSKLLSGAKTSSIFFALGALIATAASGGDPAVGALGGLSSALGPLFQMAKRIPQRDDSVALLNHYYVFYPKN